MSLPYGRARQLDPEYADLLRGIEEQLRQQGDFPDIVRETGQFLNLLAKASRARKILEIGTGDGYTTLWLAQAIGEGEIITLEPDVWRLEIARELFARSPHADRIRLLQGDPVELLPMLSGPYDFLLLGADAVQALRHLRILLERIVSAGIVCCNHAMSRSAQLAEYLAFVHETPGLESVLVPIGEGIEVTYKCS